MTKRLTDKESERLLRKLDAIEQTKEALATHRDKLRAQISEFDEIVDGMGYAIELIEAGLTDVRAGIDQASEFL